jgi:1,4-alpha-glucan branching enzyme
MLKRTTPASGITKVTFAIPIEQTSGSVSVVGEFNGWDPLAHPLKARSNRTRSVTLALPAQGCYEFKYLADDGTWFCEPDAERSVVNEYGQLNSVVTT